MCACDPGYSGDGLNCIGTDIIILCGVAFITTGPGLGLIMYILTTLQFPTHYFDFHLMTKSVNTKYYYIYIYIVVE